MSAPHDGFPRTAAVSPRVAYVESTASTNADLVLVADDVEGYPHLSVELTDDQRAGRGRLDRTWTAPAGQSIAVSVLLRVADLPVAARGWIPLAAGEAMAHAIEAQLATDDVNVKWPNDVRVGQDKICGILAEATLRRDAVVVGAGVNTTMPADQLPVPTATSFGVLDQVCDVDLLVADYLGRLDSSVHKLIAADGDAVASGLHRAVERVCSTIGAPVRIELPGGEAFVGTATGLDETGRLQVDPGDGSPISAFSAGDVVHLRPGG